MTKGEDGVIEGELKDEDAESSEEEAEEEQEDASDLASKSYTELREVAEVAKLPEDEWKKIKSQKGMVEYLKDKLA